MLAFVSTITNFGTPALLGSQVQFYVLTTKIYDYKVSGRLDQSLVLAVLLVLVAIGGIALNKLYFSRKSYSIISGKAMRPVQIRLGKSKILFLILIFIILSIAVIFPLISMSITSMLKSIGAGWRWDNLTFDNFNFIFFEYGDTKIAFRNSFFLAIVAATLVSLLGALISYIIIKTKAKGREILDFLAMIPLAIPGTVIGIAVILAWSGKYGINLYNTIWIILAAYVTKYIALSVRTNNASLRQVHTSLEETARVCGANWLESFRDVVLPLIKPGLIAGWFLVFLPCVRELTISILLVGPQTTTLGVMVYEMQEAGRTGGSAALAVIILIIVFVGRWFVSRISGGKIDL